MLHHIYINLIEITTKIKHTTHSQYSNKIKFQHKLFIFNGVNATPLLHKFDRDYDKN